MTGVGWAAELTEYSVFLTCYFEISDFVFALGFWSRCKSFVWNFPGILWACCVSSQRGLNGVSACSGKLNFFSCGRYDLMTCCAMTAWIELGGLDVLYYSFPLPICWSRLENCMCSSISLKSVKPGAMRCTQATCNVPRREGDSQLMSDIQSENVSEPDSIMFYLLSSDIRLCICCLYSKGH